MWTSSDRVWLLGFAALIAACASEDPPRRMEGVGTPTGPNAAGTMGSAPGGAAGNGGPVVPGGFGNPMGPAPMVTPMAGSMAMMDPTPIAPEDDCEEGKFCEPKGPDGNCGSVRVDTDVQTVQKPGNIMVIFDRSTSMEDAWNGVPRWQAAGEAFTNAIRPLEMLLNVGAIFFPSPAANDPNNPCPSGCNLADPFHWIPGPGACCLNLTGVQACDVNPIDAADQIAFGPAAEFLTEAPMKWRFNGLQGVVGGMGPMGMMAPTLIGATPLGAGVARAAEALKGAQFEGPMVVVILTDGAPNCDTNQTAVIQQVTEWQAQQIATHVIGLPGSGEAAQFLTSVANAGGTMDFLDPMNAQELEAKLQSILTSTVRQGFESCVFNLDRATEVPDDLHLVIRENGMDKDVPRDLTATDATWGPDAGWSINEEGTKIELKGRLCDLAKEGAYESIRFEYGCVPLPPPDPPQGPS